MEALLPPERSSRLRNRQNGVELSSYSLRPIWMKHLAYPRSTGPAHIGISLHGSIRSDHGNKPSESQVSDV